MHENCRNDDLEINFVVFSNFGMIHILCTPHPSGTLILPSIKHDANSHIFYYLYYDIVKYTMKIQLESYLTLGERKKTKFSE